MIGAGGVGQSTRRVRVRRPLQIVIEERLHVFDAKLIGGVAGERQRAQIIAVVIDAGMAPRADHQRHQVVVFVLERLVDRGAAVGIFLVPLPDDQHRRHGERSRGHPFVDRLQRPELRVGGVLHQFLDEGVLVDAPLAGVVARRSRLQVARVVVTEAEGRPCCLFQPSPCSARPCSPSWGCGTRHCGSRRRRSRCRPSGSGERPPSAPDAD